MSDNTEQFNIRFVANTPKLRERGLMKAKSLEDDEVVLFVFPHVGNYSFWNKNVSFPLTLAFVDENGKILEFGELEAQSPESVSSNSNEVKYVIESKKGIFQKKGITKGDVVVYTNSNHLLIKKI